MSRQLMLVLFFFFTAMIIPSSLCISAYHQSTCEDGSMCVWLALVEHFCHKPKLTQIKSKHNASADGPEDGL
jgi:hypothetical protein